MNEPDYAEPASAHMSQPQRRLLVRINRALDRAWRKGWCSRPSLDPDALVATARRQTRLPCALDPAARQRLELLSTDLASTAALTPLGRTIAHGQLVAALANRSRAQALHAQYPEIARLPLPRPVIVAGQMRSGSTRMQRVLACDPRLDHTRFFESWNPIPRFDRAFFDDRKARAWFALCCARLINPRFKSIHPTTPGAPDEEIGLFSLSLFGAAFEAQWNVPRFTAHCETIDTREVYREFAKSLRLITWLRGRGAARSPVLKVPQFTQDLKSLIAVFPDARVIRTQRDPVAVVASSASLALNQMQLQARRVSPHAIGREWLRKTVLRERRLDTALAEADAPRVTVCYDGMGKDWRGEIEAVYRTLKMPLPARIRRSMKGYLDRAHARGPAHAYSLERFGLDPAIVRAAMPAR